MWKKISKLRETWIFNSTNGDIMEKELPSLVICTVCKRICITTRDWNMTHALTGKAFTAGGKHMWCEMFSGEINPRWREIIAQN